MARFDIMDYLPYVLMLVAAYFIYKYLFPSNPYIPTNPACQSGNCVEASPVTGCPTNYVLATPIYDSVCGLNLGPTCRCNDAV